jgi:hypothetical protein
VDIYQTLKKTGRLGPGSAGTNDESDPAVTIAGKSESGGSGSTQKDQKPRGNLKLRSLRSVGVRDGVRDRPKGKGTVGPLNAA